MDIVKSVNKSGQEETSGRYWPASYRQIVYQRSFSRGDEAIDPQLHLRLAKGSIKVPHILTDTEDADYWMLREYVMQICDINT